jgi:hypothetical protein
VIRRATGADARALLVLAAIDEQPPLEGHALVAEVNGVVRAARSLAGGRSLADPFWPTSPLLELLELRHRHLFAADASRARGGAFRRLARFGLAGHD